MVSKKHCSRSSRRSGRRHGDIPEPTRLDRLERDWSRAAKAPVKVEWIGGTLYGFGSELAALRLYYLYRHSGPRAWVQYNTNRKSWVFSLDDSSAVLAI
jgi:hypothetical protein